MIEIIFLISFFFCKIKIKKKGKWFEMKREREKRKDLIVEQILS